MVPVRPETSQLAAVGEEGSAVTETVPAASDNNLFANTRGGPGSQPGSPYWQPRSLQISRSHNTGAIRPQGVRVAGG
jgi:hypothetical protein